MSELSISQQQIGRKSYLRFVRLNGLSFACLAESILILYALKSGVPAYMTGALAAFMYMSMPFMFLGKMLIGRVGASRTIMITWLLRNVVASIMITAPMASKMGASPITVAALIMVPSFIFFALRSMGIVAFNPLVAEITQESSRGQFVSQTMMYSYLSYFITVGLQIAAFSLHAGIATFQAIILFGCVTGVFAGWAVRKVPEGGALSESARQSLQSTVFNMFRNQRFRRLLWAQSSSLLLVVLVAPISMIALKEAYAVSDRFVLVFAMIQIAGGIGISFINGMVTDQTGPRPLMILYTTGLIGICGIWLTAPLHFHYLFAAFTFFLIGCCIIGNVLSGNHYLHCITSTSDKLGGSLLSYMVPGLIAGAGGAVLSAYTLKYLSLGMGLSGLNLYKAYFAGAALIGAICIIPVFRLERLDQWPVQQVLKLLFSPRDLWALFSLSRMEAVDGLTRDAFHVKRLAESHSNLSEGALLEFMESPSLSIRWNALRGLRNLDQLTDLAREALVHEVEHGVFTTAYIAADIAGERSIKAAIPGLRNGLRVPDVFLQGKSMLALARLRDRESLKTICQMFSESDNPRILIHGAMAFAHFGDPDLLLRIYTKLLEIDLSANIRRELLLNAAEIAGVQDEFYQFTKTFRREREATLSMLTEKLKQAQQPKLERLLLEAWQTEHRWSPSFTASFLELFDDGPLNEKVQSILETAQGRNLEPEAIACLVLILTRVPCVY